MFLKFITKMNNYKCLLLAYLFQYNIFSIPLSSNAHEKMVIFNEPGCCVTNAFWVFFRLGLFLFTRILADGRDRRFNKIKEDPKRFFVAWFLQGK